MCGFRHGRGIFAIVHSSDESKDESALMAYEGN
jgi:hypothetical protein